MYCTLEEAWGTQEMEGNDPNDTAVYDYHRYHTNDTLRKVRKPKKARRRRRVRQPPDDPTEYAPFDEHDELPVQLALQPAQHAAPPTCPTREAAPNDVDAKYHTAFARSPSLARVKNDAVDVDIANSADAVHEEEEARTTSNPDLHDELQWMRNNLSHLNDSVQRLHTQMQDTSTRAATPPTTTTQGLNTALYIITGGFVLVLLDVCYRAGARG